MKYCYLILFLLINFIINPALAATSAKPVICTGQYALCTSAPCIPDPRHPDYAICSCAVENDDSAGYASCEKRAPKQDQFKVTQIVSTFSFDQFKTKQAMNCAKGIPWTDCVDAPCTIDPMDTSKAICSCKIDHTQAYFTLGGGCDTKTCATGFWSGQTPAAGTVFRNALMKKQNLTGNPWPNLACPAP
jgi:hypothetical protein